MALPEKFADELVRILSCDLALSGRDMETMESACGAGDQQALAKLLDEHGPERDLLLSLIFTPGRKEREALESLLAGWASGPGEEEKLAALAAGRVKACRLSLPCGGRLSLEAPAWAPAAFVKGLGLGRTPPAEVCRAAAGLGPSLGPAALVVLRDAPRPWTESGAGFAARLLKRGLVREREDLEVLGRVCSLLSELGPGEAPEDLLFRKAAWAKKHLAAAGETPDGPFEVMTALGLRTAYVDERRMKRTLFCCQQAARALFGPDFAFPDAAGETGEPLAVDIAAFLAMGREGP